MKGLLVALILIVPCGAFAQTSTSVANHFRLFVPPNNDVGTRYSAVVITAMSGTAASPTLVDLVDDGADGDTDDTLLGVPLLQGQSLVRYIRDGSVNDDMQGRWDGDLFTVEASKPVSAYLVTDSDWQHDWAPAAGGTLRGTRFFLYANRVSVTPRDVNIFAYEDDTRVALHPISAAPLLTSGVTSVGARGPALMSADLDEGQDLIVHQGLGLDLLEAGHTYEIVATRPVTVQFGALGSTSSGWGVRDGGGFVPGQGGSAVDRKFYFTVPHDEGRAHEQEIRIVSADDGVSVELAGFEPASGAYVPIRSFALDRMEHADHVGGDFSLYRLEASGGDVAVFEANWLETGSPGTSDVASFAPGIIETDGTVDYLVYLGPPGRQTNTNVGDTLSHLYLFSKSAIQGVRVSDADTNGLIYDRTFDLPAGGMVDVSIDLQTYGAMNRPAQGLRPYLRVESPRWLSVLMANWNDNWMAYASAIVLRNPDVDLSLSSGFTTGQVSRATGHVRNADPVPMDHVEVEIQLPASLQFVGGSVGGTSPNPITVTSTGTEARFILGELGPGEQADIVLDLRPLHGRSGEVLPVLITAIGTSTGVTHGASAGTSAPLTSPGVVTLGRLRALPGEGAVTLTWVAEALSGLTSQLQVERGSRPEGPFTALASPVSHSGSGQPTDMSFVDTTVQNGLSYYYRIVASGPTAEEAIAGPVHARPSDVTPPPTPTILAHAMDGQASLHLSGSGGSDFLGYHVERSTPGSDGWGRLTAHPISGPTYIDDHLQNGSSYRYRAYAVDGAGNASARTSEVWVTPTGPGTRATDLVLSFEDMLGAGENDWDYNDFVVRTKVQEDISGGSIQFIAIDYEPLARGAGYVHTLRQRINAQGRWQAVIHLYASDEPTRIISSSSHSGVGEIDIPIYADTLVASPPTVGNYTNTRSEQPAFEPGVTARMTIELLDGELDGSLHAAPYDLYLALPYISGLNEIHRSNHAGSVELTTRPGPLQDVHLPFVVEYESHSASWPLEGLPIWVAYPGFVDSITDPTGTGSSWPSAPASEDLIFRRDREGDN